MTEGLGNIVKVHINGVVYDLIYERRGRETRANVLDVKTWRRRPINAMMRCRVNFCYGYRLSEWRFIGYCVLWTHLHNRAYYVNPCIYLCKST